MARAAMHQRSIIEAAGKLFRQRGYAATGLADILALSKAPRGSFYHYFPGGKIDVAVAVAEGAGPVGASTLEAMGADGAPAFKIVLRYADQLAIWLEESDYSEGCPIATLLLELADTEPAIAEAGRASLAQWAEAVARPLLRDGFSDERAGRLARFAVAAIEGGLILARVARDRAPLIEAGEEAALAIEAAYWSEPST